MNVSTVFAHEKKWRNFFLDHSQHFTKVESIGRYMVFKLHQFPNSYFLEGTGSIKEQNTSSVTLSLQSDRAVIKFAWFPFVKASGCTVKPVTISTDITFIELSECAEKDNIVIESISPLKRWML